MKKKRRLFYRLFNAFSAVPVFRRSHHDLAAKLCYGIVYTFIVGCDINIAEHFRCLFVYMLNDGLVAEHNQWLAGEACRGISCRYYSDKIHNFYSISVLFMLCLRGMKTLVANCTCDVSPYAKILIFINYVLSIINFYKFVLQDEAFLLILEKNYKLE